MNIIIFILALPVVAGFIIAATRFVDRSFTGWFYDIQMWKKRILNITPDLIKSEVKRQKLIKKENEYYDHKLPELRKQTIHKNGLYSSTEGHIDAISERLTHTDHGSFWNNETQRFEGSDSAIGKSKLPKWIIAILKMLSR